jgi:hypothetical protein
MDNIIFIVGTVISVAWGAMVALMLYGSEDDQKK